MIRFSDAIVLACTKLRTHKVRTGVAVGIAGILFGLILGVIFVSQGVFDSLARFDKEGLNNRPLIGVMHLDSPSRVFDLVEDEDFIDEVKRVHAQEVAKKQAAAKKYAIPYNPERDDPTPVLIDDSTKKEYIENISHQSVEIAAQARQKPSTFSIHEIIKPYATAEILEGNKDLVGLPDATLEHMKDGKEFSLESKEVQGDSGFNGSGSRSLSVLNQSIAEPFINKDNQFNTTKGELPVIMPFKDAEKLLNLKPLEKKASTQEKYDRLAEVRKRSSEITVSFCYRNKASQQLLEDARSQAAYEKKNKNKEDYIKPSIQYELPEEDSCGAVTRIADRRTAKEKDFDERKIAFEKELGVYIGEPEQYKLNLRAVGISGDAPSLSNSVIDVNGMVNSILGSWLGYDTWIIPGGLLQQVPAADRPAVIFGDGDTEKELSSRSAQARLTGAYTVEFKSKDEARRFIEAHSAGEVAVSEGMVIVQPFGSNLLLIQDMKDRFAVALGWMLLVVGSVAVVILGSIIGRTVSEGRRESAIFRAIGARRTDISLVYGAYAFLLSLRVVLFTVVLGIVLALGVEIWIGKEATLAVRYAYAATETDASFHFLGLLAPYTLIVIATIIVFGMIASIIPMIASARRNPINDMRNDT